MNKVVAAGLVLLCLAPLAVPVMFATTEEFPSWAYPVDPPTALGTSVPKDDGTLLHVPDSEAGFTRAQIESLDTVPDWHANDHLAMPSIVQTGRDGVRACAHCHHPSGAGRPENASLAGLTENYIKQQIDNFRKGNRKGSEPKRAPQVLMNQIAAKLTDEEIDQAAKYFSSLTLGSYIKVVETEIVPKTVVTQGMLAPSPEGGMEPIGQRIIEVPEDLERALKRDPRTPYVAYVPLGSLEKGWGLVTAGAMPCTGCHGPDLHGLGDVPHIGGRSPTYIVRQLYDVQTGNRTGGVAPMQQVVSGLKLDEMIAVAAYVASREP